MGGEWAETRVGNLLSFANGRSSPERADRLPYPVYGSNGIIGYASDANSDPGTIIIGRVGSYCGSLYQSPQKCWVTDNAIRAVAKNGNDPRFLYYLLGTLALNSRRAGSGQPLLNQDILSSIPTSAPEPAEQRAIAHILGTLDDKIELNRRRNQTLEAMARALFKDWFVDFGPVRAKMEGREPYLPADLWQLFPDRLDENGKPEGWTSRPIYDFANVVYGAPFASKQFNTEGAGTPLIRIRDLASNEPGVWTQQDHPKGHLIEPGDIVVGMDGEFRLHVWKGQPAWLNQRVCHFEPLPGVPSSFLTEALVEPLAYFERGKVGTTVIHLGKSDIDTFRLLHPGDGVLKAFGHVAEPWLAAIVRNALESRTLAHLRDTLLPKLISGELRIQDAEQFIEVAQ